MSSVITRLGRLCDKMAEVSECGKGKKCNKPCKKSKKKAKNECNKNECGSKGCHEWMVPMWRKPDFQADGLSVWDLKDAKDAQQQLAGNRSLGIAAQGDANVFDKYRQRGPIYLCRWGLKDDQGVVVNVSHRGEYYVTNLQNSMPDKYTDPLEMLGKYPQLAPAVKNNVFRG